MTSPEAIDFIVKTVTVDGLRFAALTFHQIMADEESLNTFYLVTEALRKAMQADMPLNESDQLRLENQMAVLHMAYVEWKRRNLSRQRNIVWNSSIDKSATHARRLS